MFTVQWHAALRLQPRPSSMDFECAATDFSRRLANGLHAGGPSDYRFDEELVIQAFFGEITFFLCNPFLEPAVRLNHKTLHVHLLRLLPRRL